MVARMTERTADKLNLAVLISGRGSNLQSIIDACAHTDFPAHIRVVVSNEPEAYGLQRAMAVGIPTEIVPHKSYPSRREFEEALAATLQNYPVDLICLAGFMRVLTPEFVSHWEGRILNIHPSLLPAYPGLHTHERVLQGGDKESGCTIHFVTPGLDEGPTLVQRRVPVLSHDTPDTLAARVLEQEHIAYPEAIRLIALGKVKYTKDFVEIGEADPYVPQTKPAVQAPPSSDIPDRPISETVSEQPLATKETTMNHSSLDNAPDEAAVRSAQRTWHNFVKASELLTLHVIGILVFLALVFL